VRYVKWAVHQLFHFNCFICKSGHHRSVAFVELLRAVLVSRFPDLEVIVWHLDHHKEPEKHRDLQALQELEQTNQDRYEYLFEEPISQLYSDNWNPTSGCMPRALLHDQRLHPTMSEGPYNHVFG
jgi:hypothetical protein